jgi:hypothetical protein
MWLDYANRYANGTCEAVNDPEQIRTPKVLVSGLI